MITALGRRRNWSMSRIHLVKWWKSGRPMAAFKVTRVLAPPNPNPIPSEFENTYYSSCGALVMRVDFLSCIRCTSKPYVAPTLLSHDGLLRYLRVNQRSRALLKDSCSSQSRHILCNIKPIEKLYTTQFRLQTV